MRTPAAALAHMRTSGLIGSGALYEDGGRRQPANRITGRVSDWGKRATTRGCRDRPSAIADRLPGAPFRSGRFATATRVCLLGGFCGIPGAHQPAAVATSSSLDAAGDRSVPEKRSPDTLVAAG